MKTAFRYTCVLLVLLAYTLTTEVFAGDHKWGLEIELAKQAYVSHEPIWLDVTLTNNASDTVRTHGLDTPSHLGFYISLTDSRGDTIKYTGPQWLFDSSPGRLLLEPGEQDFGSFDLTGLFFSHDDFSGYAVHLWYFPHIPTGAYSVQVYFEGTASNVQTCNIVEPEGEEKEVLELIEDATRLSRKDSRKLSAQVFKEIVDRYPNSVFSEMCFYLTHTHGHTNEMRQGTYTIEEKLHFTGEMIENYPNSGHSRDWLRAITWKIENGRKLTVLNKVLEAHPNTRSFKFAQQMKKRTLEGGAP